MQWLSIKTNKCTWKSHIVNVRQYLQYSSASSLLTGYFLPEFPNVIILAISESNLISALLLHVHFREFALLIVSKNTKLTNIKYEFISFWIVKYTNVCYLFVKHLNCKEVLCYYKCALVLRLIGSQAMKIIKIDTHLQID